MRRLLSWLKKGFEAVSPIRIKPTASSIEIGFSERFLLFKALRQLAHKLEDDPYENFVSILKSYKVLGHILTGTVREFHRDRRKLYFMRFFPEKALYEDVKADLEWLIDKKPQMRMTITKNGLIVYDNYKKNSFNVLLFTVHSGTWMPERIEKKQSTTKEERYLEEDVGIHRVYSSLVLDKNGIWIDNKFSRFACDVNREPKRAIYENNSEEWLDVIWKRPLTTREHLALMEGYDEFYFTISRLVETHRFNIVFDGHSMKDLPGRPQISFGTEFIPYFYMPIVRTMKNHLKKMGYGSVEFDTPFGGGNIVRWMAERFPDLFICSMEVNKSLYMTPGREEVVEEWRERLSRNLSAIFDIETVKEAKEREHDLDLRQFFTAPAMPTPQGRSPARRSTPEKEG